jgi:hypothetical protein
MTDPVETVRCIEGAPARTPDLLDRCGVIERLGMVRRSTTSLALAIKGADLEPETGEALRELALEIRDSIDALTSDIEQERVNAAHLARLRP